MVDEVRQLAIEWQYWASEQNLSTGEILVWQSGIETLAHAADPSGELTKELEENGVI